MTRHLAWGNPVLEPVLCQQPGILGRDRRGVRLRLVVQRLQQRMVQRTGRIELLTGLKKDFPVLAELRSQSVKLSRRQRESAHLEAALGGQVRSVAHGQAPWQTVSDPA